MQLISTIMKVINSMLKITVIINVVAGTIMVTKMMMMAHVDNYHPGCGCNYL